MNECKEHKYRVQGEITDGGCPYCRIAELEQQLAEAHEELALSIKERIELGGKLSRYQGGVEVEGVISSVIRTSDYTEAIVVSITPQCIWGIIDQRVRVLVMKEME